MFKRRTSKVRSRRQVQVLKANVMSPLIAWFGFLRVCGQLGKGGLILGAVAGVVWGGWVGAKRWIFESEEFRLQAIELTPNSAMDERRFVRLAGIDLNGGLFDCDAAEIEERLRELPEIASAEVRRKYPGTLVVGIVAREPHVWVASASQGVPPRDLAQGLLVDRSGIAYPCPPGQREAALALPVIELGEGGEALRAGEPVSHPEFDRALRLHAELCKAAPEAAGWIDSIRQSRPWALEVISRDGIAATFGLGDHPRQVADFLASVGHSRREGQAIASINLIPERNIPVTLRGDRAPRAVLVPGQEGETDPSLEGEPAPPPPNHPPGRRDRDLRQLLNRR